MSKNTKKMTIVSAVIISSVLISGCSLLGGKESVDPPQNTTYEEDAAKDSTKETTGEVATEETMPVELYLMDKYGYIVPQTLNLPKTNSVAKESLEYLVKGGKVTELLPNDFQAVLPENTEVTVNIKDKVATVDFSSAFNEYEAENESKILQSVTWTLTQFDTIDSVKLTVAGKELTEMPVNKTPIQGELTRADGINIDTENVTDIANTRPLTVYYLGGEMDSYYYVPVTKRVSNAEEDNIASAVGELIEGPGSLGGASSLMSFLTDDVKLLDDPVVADGKVTLNFNENIYTSGLEGEEKVVADEVLNSIVLSLTEQKGIEGVSITVNGEADLVNAEGESLTEPVTRPENVNTGSF
ncbi:GerMN domain-containing protein [Bacillus sp. B1-b2]|uniref:GerMN domain-containing protein n=1 Tax=Bacillus sp. B1-b2 TaxID=2653201 RepID=UPI0012619034|nr:GerMN domain-containing protein [Bacillus sp. B1-b2]KAB7668060.1 sporulation protein [Bacillus sp. B1-b2]